MYTFPIYIALGTRLWRALKQLPGSEPVSLIAKYNNSTTVAIATFAICLWFSMQTMCYL